MSGKAILDHDREVGRRIRVRRKDLGISQGKLGDALGLTFQQIQKYEKGVNRIGAGRLQQIAKFLKVPMGFFFDADTVGPSGGDNVFTLLDTGYSLRLMKAFVRIQDRRIQRSTVELVEGIAEATRSVAAKSARASAKR